MKKVQTPSVAGYALLLNAFESVKLRQGWNLASNRSVSTPLQNRFWSFGGADFRGWRFFHQHACPTTGVFKNYRVLQGVTENARKSAGLLGIVVSVYA